MNTEQERAAFEAWFTKTKAYISDPKYIFAQIVRDIALEAWQARAALQSQDKEDVTVLKVALEESRQTMKAVLAQERLKDVAKRCLSRTIGITDRAIDHARRIEGGET